MASGSDSLMKYIYVTLALLFADGVIEMGFVTSTVAYLHSAGSGPFQVAYQPSQNIELYGKPASLIVNHGHTTNGASGTIVVLLGIGGVLALWLQHRSQKKFGNSSSIFYLWALLTFLSWLLTLVALIYVFVVTSMTKDQTIDLAVAAANQSPAKYPNDDWTPENWYLAVLALLLTSQDDVSEISHRLRIMRGWRYNLIPMFILGFILVDLVAMELLRLRKAQTRSGGAYDRAATGDMMVESPEYGNAYNMQK